MLISSYNQSVQLKFDFAVALGATSGLPIRYLNVQFLRIAATFERSADRESLSCCMGGVCISQLECPDAECGGPRNTSKSTHIISRAGQLNLKQAAGLPLLLNRYFLKI